MVINSCLNGALDAKEKKKWSIKIIQRVGVRFFAIAKDAVGGILCEVDVLYVS